jgi:hypothetical protein
LFTKSESARNGRAMETISASPLASTSSPISGVLMRLLATRGTETFPYCRPKHRFDDWF